MPTTCRRCGRGELHPSEPKSLFEYLAHFVFRRPFTCSYCNTRTLRFSLWDRHRTHPDGKRVPDAWTNPKFSPTSNPPPSIDEVRTRVRQMEEKLSRDAQPEDKD